MHLFSVYDIFNLFKYDLDYRIKVYVKFIVYFNRFSFEINENNSKSIEEDIIKVNNLNCSVKKFIDIYIYLKEDGYFNCYNFIYDNKLLSIFKYMFGPCKGRYFYLFNENKIPKLWKN